MPLVRMVSILALIGLSLASCKSTGNPQTASQPAKGALPQLGITFNDPSWNGDSIPPGQQCSKFGGRGATPPLSISGVPAGTSEIVVEFNDRDYAPLSSNGGHGIIGFAASAPGGIELPSVPGETRDMPEGARVIASTRASGGYYVPGYLPPCSGGRGNRYFAVVKAKDTAGVTLALGHIDLGRY